jgi:putative PIN family toxin of toxin-antitoxin system
VLDRVVLDTSVMVAAMRSDRGASRKLLVWALEGRFILLISVPLMFEYESVMTRPEHLQASRLSAEDIQAILDAVVTIGEAVALDYLWRPALPDADDDMVLETAVKGSADQIVTFNSRDFRTVARAFGIDVMSPSAAVPLVKGER